MRITFRLLLLAIYLALATAITFVVLAYGEGSTSPALIFGSWGVVLARIIHIPSLIIIILAIMLYVALVFYLNTVLAKRSSLPVPVVTGFVHGLGCVVSVLLKKPVSNSPDLEVAGYVVSIALVVFYLELDWILASSSQRHLSSNTQE